MDVVLFRKLNAIGMLLVCAVLAMGFYSQFTQDELPCPLCLLQRVATVAVLCGLMLNVVKGPKPDHYSIMIIAAYSTQYHKQKFIPFREQAGLAKVAIVVSLAFVALNAVATFVECGPIECPSNPTSYWLFN